MLSLLSLPQKIAAGAHALALAIVAAWGIHEHVQAGRWEAAAEKNASRYLLETAKHSITRSSLDRVTAALDDQSRSVRQLATDSATRTEAAAQGRKAAEKDAQRREEAARALDASAAKPHNGEPCAPSDVFWTDIRKEL